MVHAVLSLSLSVCLVRYSLVVLVDDTEKRLLEFIEAELFLRTKQASIYLRATVWTFRLCLRTKYT